MREKDFRNFLQFLSTKNFHIVKLKNGKVHRIGPTSAHHCWEELNKEYKYFLENIDDEEFTLGRVNKYPANTRKVYHFLRRTEEGYNSLCGRVRNNKKIHLLSVVTLGELYHRSNNQANTMYCQYCKAVMFRMRGRLRDNELGGKTDWKIGKKNL